MQKTTKIFVSVIVVAALCAVAAGVVFYDEDSEGDHVYDGALLIEDNTGAYFWVHGDGDDFADVLTYVDGNRGFDAEYTVTDGVMTVTSVNGLANYDTSYWAAYYYKTGEWHAVDSLSDICTDDYGCAALFYVETEDDEITAGGPDYVTVPDVNKQAFFSGSDDDFVFAIQSYSGMYFYLNGHGDDALTALNDAAEDYALPLTVTDGAVDTIFGLSSWTLYTSDNGSAWASTDSALSAISEDSVDAIAIVCTTNSTADVTDVPIYSEDDDDDDDDDDD